MVVIKNQTTHTATGNSDGIPMPYPVKFHSIVKFQGATVIGHNSYCVIEQWSWHFSVNKWLLNSNLTLVRLPEHNEMKDTRMQMVQHYANKTARVVQLL